MDNRLDQVVAGPGETAAERGRFFNRISYQLIAVVAIVVFVGLTAMALLYAERQRTHILATNAEAMRKVTESVIKSLQSVMLAGYADIAQVYADRLKEVEGVVDFRILRTSGNEAFRDNRTIEEVNEYRGDDDFDTRAEERVVPVMEADDPALRRTVEEKRIVSFTETGALDAPFLTFLAPIEMSERCDDCHSLDDPVRGVLKLTTSLGPVEEDIRASQYDALKVLVVAAALILSITILLVRHSVIRPINAITAAMAAVSRGRFDREVPVLGRDELAEMARNFNRMIRELNQTYIDLENEQNKLATLILSAREGIVSTNPAGQVVLVNPAASRILDKSREAIEMGGFEQLFDDPVQLNNWLADPHSAGQGHILEYRNRFLHVNVATIRDPDGILLGKTALFRDMTRERQLEKQLRQLSLTDGLTGLYNRRFIDETLAHELLRARRSATPLAVVMLDIDHFKRFNDEHGHEQGDRVLQAVAGTLRALVREADLACRYGGEEFLVILPSTSLQGGARLAERVRAAIAALDVDGLSVTASLGVADLDAAADNPGTLVEIADRRLYRAKAEGRNRVVAGDAPPPAAD